MSDKLQTAREYILRKIENGELRGGRQTARRTRVLGRDRRFARDYADGVHLAGAGRHSDQRSATGNLHPRRLAAADSA